MEKEDMNSDTNNDNLDDIMESTFAELKPLSPPPEFTTADTSPPDKMYCDLDVVKNGVLEDDDAVNKEMGTSDGLIKVHQEQDDDDEDGDDEKMDESQDYEEDDNPDSPNSIVDVVLVTEEASSTTLTPSTNRSSIQRGLRDKILEEMKTEFNSSSMLSTPSPEMQKSSSQLDISTSSNSPTKKRRGRPRKHPPVEKKPINPGPRVGPGRPRKIRLPVEETLLDAETELIPEPTLAKVKKNDDGESASEASSESSDGLSRKAPMRRNSSPRSLRLSRASSADKGPKKAASASTTPTPSPARKVGRPRTKPVTDPLLVPPKFTKTGKRKYKAYKGLNYAFGYKKKKLGTTGSGRIGRESASGVDNSSTDDVSEISSTHEPCAMADLSSAMNNVSILSSVGLVENKLLNMVKEKAAAENPAKDTDYLVSSSLTEPSTSLLASATCFKTIDRDEPTVSTATKSKSPAKQKADSSVDSDSSNSTRSSRSSKSEGSRISPRLKDSPSKSLSSTCSASKLVDAKVVIAKEASASTQQLMHSPTPDEIVPPVNVTDEPVTSATDRVAEVIMAKAECCCDHNCRIRGVPPKQNGKTLTVYCQALDSYDDRVVGCCSMVTDFQMLRPSMKCPFLVMCDLHIRRLKLHHCCPGCGMFCTQGQFLQCHSGDMFHLSHRKCQMVSTLYTNETASDLSCLHCAAPVVEIKLILKTHTYPVFLLSQDSFREGPSAKMCLRGYLSSQLEENAIPVVSTSSCFVLPSGKTITLEGLPEGVEHMKMATLLESAHEAVDKSVVPRYSQKSLFQCVKTSVDQEKILQILAQGLSPNFVHKDQNGQISLHAAASSGQLLNIHIVVQAGAQLDTLDAFQQTPLMLAVLKGHNPSIRYLVAAGASVEFKGEDGMTALHLAARGGNVEACHSLLTSPKGYHQLINMVDDGGWTALVWSADHQHIHVARYLLERNADPHIRDSEQNVALHWAAFSGCMDISLLLLGHGCQVNVANAHGDTPLHIAARNNNYECCILFLSRGADLDLRNKAGDDALGCCVIPNSEAATAIGFNVQMRKITERITVPFDKLLTNDITKGKEQNPIQCVNRMDPDGIPTDYLYVGENCFTSNIHVDTTITSLKYCLCIDNCSVGSCSCGSLSWRCWYSDEGKLLPEFNYIDPPMLFECNRACNCNKVTCNNRVVQHGVMPRMQLFKTAENKGWGVRTLKPLPKGSYVCEYIGELISDCEADQREDDSYLFDLDNKDGETYCIDARRYGNIARFINHMCDPNLIPVKVFIDHQDMRFPRIAFFANRNIEQDEELGFDYGEKFWIIKCKSFTCTCGSTKCKYSETTIQQTLEAYRKRLQEDEDSIAKCGNENIKDSMC